MDFHNIVLLSSWDRLKGFPGVNTESLLSLGMMSKCAFFTSVQILDALFLISGRIMMFR